jgi:hypothetical protein
MLKQVAIVAIMVLGCASNSDTVAFMEEWDRVMRGFVPDD